MRSAHPNGWADPRLDTSPDETFTVVLSDPVGGAIADGEGLGTIVDDDAPLAEDDEDADSGDTDDSGSQDDGGASVAGTGEERGPLPRTGATVVGLAGLGLLLVLGASVPALRRRFA